MFSIVKLSAVLCVLSCANARHMSRRDSNFKLNDNGAYAHKEVPLLNKGGDQLSGFGNLDLEKSYRPTNIGPVDSSKRITAATGLQLDTDSGHKLGASVFTSHTSPLDSVAPSFNTYGGALDYKYKDTVGAGFKAAHTPMFDHTKYDAAGSLNLFKTRDSSLDFNAGMSKSMSPYQPRSNWEPFLGFGYRTTW